MAESISFFWQIPAHGHVWTNSPWRNATHTHSGLSPLAPTVKHPLVQSDSESTRRFDLKEIDKLQCWIQNKTLKAQYSSSPLLNWLNKIFSSEETFAILRTWLMTCWTTVLTCSQEVRNLAYLESNAESKAISCTNLSFTYISS